MSDINEITWDLGGGPSHFPGGLMAGYTKTYRVDKGGKSYDSTIPDAIARAQDAGAGTSFDSTAVIEVGPGLHIEPFALTAGIHLVGTGVRNCMVQADGVTIESGTSVTDIYFLPPSGGTDLQGLYVDVSANAHVVIRRCYMVIDRTVDDHVTALRIGGTGGTANGNIVYIDGSYLYARNRYNGAGTNGKLSIMHVAPSCTALVEARSNHYKSSSETGKLKTPVGFWYEAGLSGYFSIEGGMWSCERADDTANPPYIVRSNTTNTLSARLPISFAGAVNGMKPRVDIPAGSRVDWGGQFFDFVDTSTLYVRGTQASTPVVKYLAAAVPLAASTSVALPGLSLPVVAGETWELNYMLPVTVTGGTAGVIPVLSAPAGSTGWFQISGTSSSATSTTNTTLSTNITAGTAGTGYVTASFGGWVMVRSVITFTNSGTLSISLATGASAAGSVLANAVLRAARV
jgi:hypothetical protein